MLARIWEQAIVQKGDDITDDYIKLFRDHEDCADISLANEQVSSSTVKTIWSRLRTSSPDAFFYSGEDSSESDTAGLVNWPLPLSGILRADNHTEGKCNYNGPQETT